MPYTNPAQQKAYLARYRKSRKRSSCVMRQAESKRKKAWYKAHRNREQAKRRARNFQARHLLENPVSVVFLDKRKARGYSVTYRLWYELTPHQAMQCFYRDEDGVLQLRTKKQQLDWIKAGALKQKPYSLIQGKIWFNRDCVMTIPELKEWASRLPRA